MELKTFCCNISLKNGTILIGILQSIFAFMFMILSGAYANNPHELVDMSDPSIVPTFHTLKCILITVSVASALYCIFSLLLIFGCLTNRPLLFLPWLIFNPLSIVVYVIGTLIAMAHHTSVQNTFFIIGHMILAITLCCAGGYKLLAVHSYYKHLKSLNF